MPNNHDFGQYVMYVFMFILIVELIIFLIVPDPTKIALSRLEKQIDTVKAREKTVETKITNVYQMRSDNDAKIAGARKIAAQNVSHLDTSGVVLALRNELTGIRSRDRGDMGAGRQHNADTASSKGSAIGTSGIECGKRGAEEHAGIGAGGNAGADNGSAGTQSGNTEGAAALTGDDSSASKAGEDGESEDSDSRNHWGISDSTSDSSLKVGF
ncbi:MAG: hypothetical protein RR214_00835 [Synergistaceae bacterium]